MVVRRPSPGSSVVPRAEIIVMAGQGAVAVAGCSCGAGIGCWFVKTRRVLKRIRKTAVTGIIPRIVRMAGKVFIKTLGTAEGIMRLAYYRL